MPFVTKMTDAGGMKSLMRYNDMNATIVERALLFDYLVVAGGGSGGFSAPGGGGAGGLRSTVTATGGGGPLESPLGLTLDTNYTVTVGAGGAFPGTAGVNSTFSTITSTGGGRGGGNGQGAATVGGSGGGGMESGGSQAGANGTSNQGYKGGDGNGGGGGAGAIGFNGYGLGVNLANSGGIGGAGVATSISGSSVTYASGGSAYYAAPSATRSPNPSTGGGGGASVNNGVANTGGGGAADFGNGGSGIVVVRYPGTVQKAYGGTVTVSGGNTIHTFNSSSTFYTGITLPVSGASLWLDASDATTFTFSSGTVVSQWNDKSGNGRNFAQATVANQPTRNTNIQNGYAGVIGTANDVLSTSYNWVNSAFTVFLVVKPSSTSGFMGWMGSHTTTGCPALGTANTTGEYSLFRTGISTNPSNLVATLSNADVAVWKSSGVSGGTVSSTIYKNGTQSSTNPGYSSSGTGTIATLFASSTGLDDPCTGYLFEVIVYPSQLSDIDRNKVEGYLRAKWGTP
jgi:hypothetical protein